MVRTYLLNRNELEKISYQETDFSDGRREKIAKLAHEDDRQLSASAELLLIYALRQLDPELALPLQIREEETGNLLLESAVGDCPQLYFNISHSKDYAACAVSDAPVGIDIESVRMKEVAHIDRILHPDELAVMSFVTNPDEQKKYFFECWVTKESYLKNLGCGLTVRPSNFHVEEDELVTEEKGLLKRYVHVCKSSEIQNTDWHFDAGYRLAICTQKKDPDMQTVLLSVADFQ